MYQGAPIPIRNHRRHVELHRVVRSRSRVDDQQRAHAESLCIAVRNINNAAPPVLVREPYDIGSGSCERVSGRVFIVASPPQELPMGSSSIVVRGTVSSIPSPKSTSISGRSAGLAKSHQVITSIE